MSSDDLFPQWLLSTTTISGNKLTGIKVRLASPEKIREWSFGEVKKPETINYRTFKPARDGLFCANIFGPVKDYECSCGKYSRMKHRGIVCEKCGVEVIASKVRRDRMGHIELVAPVSHIWFLRNAPFPISTLLDIDNNDLEKVLYFEAYMVIDPGQTTLNKKQVISEEQYFQIIDSYGDKAIRVGMGAELIRDLLTEIDLEKLKDELREESQATRSQTKKKKIAKRLKIVEAFIESENKCEWMIMETIPVIPPELRPLIPLDGGKFATSDLNDLYRRVVNRNNRTRRLLELGAPDIITRNEKRMLQESVDDLFDNGLRGRAITGTHGRPLKSLSDMIKGKQGRFRQNLLGKWVDYSGRTVIVVGPNLKLHQCGLPKTMALELFKPFLYSQMEEKGHASTIKRAREMVERGDEVVWDILDEVVKEYPILLNRAPTLHRLGIQAFEPILVEGKAIRLHPLVSSAFNADFDGDQMAVHIPLSIEAQVECRVLIMSTNNILSPANGEPIILPSQDIVLGLYYLTVDRSFEKGEGKIFSDPGEVIAAYDGGCVDLHAKIRVRIDGQLVETTPGRIIVGEILPEEVPFSLVNRLLTKKTIAKLVGETYRRAGTKATVILCDKLKDMGYEYSTRAGITIGVKDLEIPATKEEILSTSQAQVNEIENQYREGIITRTEKYNKIVDVWTKATNDISAQMMKEISKDILTNPRTGEKVENISLNPIYMMSNSGARGNKDQMRQLAGMRGLMAKPSGEIIEMPITSCFREGLTPHQYFVSSYDIQKNLTEADSKSNHAKHIIRRLIDVVHDVVVSEYDCGAVDAIELTHLRRSGAILEKVSERALGRIVMNDVLDPETGEVIVSANEMIAEEAARRIDTSGINTLNIRSTLTCKTKRGICALCYGRDLSRGRLVSVGEAVGIIAAQSIGERGTQLTMRTFHIGGTASREIATDVGGIVRFTDIIEGRTFQEKVDEATSRATRAITEYRSTNFRPSISICDEKGNIKHRPGKTSEAIFQLPVGAILMVNDGDEVKAWDVIARKPRESSKTRDIVDGLPRVAELFEVRKPKDQAIVSEIDGIVSFGSESKGKRKIIISPEIGDPREYLIPKGRQITVQEGNFVEAGELITEGNPDLHDILKIKGEKYLANYLVEKIQKLYRVQRVQINDKHIEVVIRQMLKKVQVIDPGDTSFLIGQQVEKAEFIKENERCISQGKEPAMAEPMVLGITQASLNTESFISEASGEETTEVLTNAVIMAKVDKLRGLKENVIVGRLIQAGTCYKPYVNSDITLPEQPEKPDRFLEKLDDEIYFKLE